MKEELPIAILCSNIALNASLMDFAKEVVTKTQSIIQHGGSNRYQDLLNNKYAYYDIDCCWESEVNFKLLSNDEIEKLSKLSAHDILALYNVLKRLVRSYRFGIGNCADLSAVGLYWASDANNILKSVSLVSVKYFDHIFLKLESKDNQTIYVDPWFLTKENSGAIFDELSLELYLSKALPLLYLNFYMQFLGAVYPKAPEIAVLLLAFALSSQSVQGPALLVLFGICLLPLSMLPVAASYYLSTPQINTHFTIVNEPQSSKVYFELFKKLGSSNLENVHPEPLSFSKKMVNRMVQAENLSLTQDKTVPQITSFAKSKFA